jgi:hypothetical protein
MPLNQQALGTLNAQQQAAVQQALGISKQQRQQKGLMDEWQAYQAAVQGLAGGAAPPPAGPAPPAPSAPPAGGGVTGGNPRGMYRQMGGQSGTGMDFKDFKKWYRTQTEGVGMDLNQYLEMSGLATASTLGGKPNEQAYGPGANVVTAGSDLVHGFTSADQLSEAAQLHRINQVSPVQYGSLQEAKDAMALASGMAGVQQWNYNLGQEGPEGQSMRGENLPDYLLNASMQDIRYEPHAWNLLLQNMLNEWKDPAAMMEQRQALVPDWAADVDKQLQQQGNIPGREGQTGMPFGFELMADPNINYTDPSKTLWEGAYPPSLQALHQNQAGEGAFLQGLSMQEVMQNLYPLVYAQHHRPAGSEAPFEAGLSMGSPAIDRTTGQMTRSPIFGYSHRFQADPDAIKMWGAEEPGVGGAADISRIAGPGGWAGGLYNRWAAFGMPGTTDWDAQTYGRTLTGGNPDFQPSDFGYNDAQVAANPRLAKMIEDMLARQEQGYWNIPYYSPWRNLPPDVQARLQALIGNPVGAGGENTLTAGYGA